MTGSLIARPGERKLLIPDDLTKNNFDCLRFFLALFVILTHSYVIYFGALEYIEPLYIFTHNQENFGTFAVNLFFVISGFLVVRSYEYRKSLKQYFSKRFFRIVPGFIGVWFASLLLGLLGTITLKYKFGNWASYIDSLSLKWSLVHLLYFEVPSPVKTFSHNPIPNNLNGALWSIKYEVLCYLVIPVFGLASSAKKKWLALALFILSYSLLVSQSFGIIKISDPSSYYYLYWPSLLPRILSFFFAGTVAYFFKAYIIRNTMLAVLSFISLAIGAILAPWFTVLLPLAGTYLLFYIAYHSKIKLNNFAKHGDFSYGLYLYGWPIQQVTMYFLFRFFGLYSIMFLYYVFTFIAAFLSWNFIEKPFLRKGKLVKASVM